MIFLTSVIFQAEDGIRDIGVTGVQTCALPILADTMPGKSELNEWLDERSERFVTMSDAIWREPQVALRESAACRSEERRVGKECRSRRAPYHYKKENSFFLDFNLDLQKVKDSI